MATSATVTFKTKPELKNRVRELAKETHRTESFFYNALLEQYLEDLEDIYLAEKVLSDIKSGKEKTIPAEEVYKELGI